MKKYIAILGILLGTAWAGCQDELATNGNNPQRNPEEGLPVMFTTEILPREMAGGALSRAGITDDYKQDFIEVYEEEDGEGNTVTRGDFLHVSATFTLLGADGQPVTAPGTAETVTQYELLQYEDGEWQSTDGTLLRWPWNAEKGTFTVYYVSESRGFLNGEADGSFDVDLGTLTSQTDPLKAVTEDVEYGYAVPLKFEHLCTKLSITDVSTRGSEYWAKIEQTTGTGIANQFSLKLNDDGTLTHSFSSIGDNPHVSAQRTADNYVSYYLAPGDYAGMSLTYRYDRPYLTLNIEQLNGVNGEDGLQAGKSYVVSITENLGSIEIDEDEDDWWDDPDEEDVTEVELNSEEINAFLKAICDGQAWSQNGTPVLGVSPDINGGTELLVSVDFQDNSFSDHDLPTTAVFNGNYHYIKNVSRPLFNQINGGRILNLCLSDVSIETKEGATSPEYVTSAGAMARESTTAGDAIQNVRLNEVTIKVKPTTDYDTPCNVGALVGISNSTMSDIALGGDIHIEVYTTDGERRLGTINVGGIIGQLNASGNLSNVSRLEEEAPGTLTVTSACTNQLGDRNTGGLVGLSNGHIADCTLSNTTVDASQTRGILVYTGGLVGMARGTVGTHGTTSASDANGIFRSTFDGTIKCGRAYSHTATENEEAVEGHAYAGGVVGYAYWSDQITDNEIFGTIAGPIGEGDNPFQPLENSIYATGGLIGQAYNAPTSGNTTWICFENVGANDEENDFYVGKVAGRADTASQATSNTSHVSGDWNNIGATIDASDLPGEETGN